MMSFIRSYGKVNEADNERLVAQRKTRRRITIIALSSIVLVAIVLAAVLGSTLSPNGKSHSESSNNGVQSVSKSVQAICQVTLYPDSCYTSLSAAAANLSQINPEGLFKLSVQVAMGELSKASDHLSKNGFNGLINNNMTKAALENCFELLDLALDHLNDTLHLTTDVSVLEAVDDLKTWLSASGTYQQTCIDGIESANEEMKSIVSDDLKSSTESTSNSLAIISSIADVLSSFKLRRLMSYSDDDCNDDKFPKWMSPKDRKLLQSSTKKLKIDAVVAKDGSGKYKTIKAALKKVPEKSDKRFVIYVKKGVYFENVKIEKKMWNVMMIGDGMNSTIVSGSLNFIDGTPTFGTATFASFGKGFMARDMGFRNTAGPTKHQAVALMASSDETIFYRCEISAYQDSLYAHAQRQFFRECNVFGTVDFIFGNAAVIIQNSSIRPIVPSPGQQNTITAQGKVDPNQNTGIVIDNCSILPGGNLTNVKNYLGRPWKTYSTTVIMRTMIASFIDPTGWLPWNATAPTDKLFYSEFRNYGPGSSTKNRIKWKGVKNNISVKQASKFTVKPFLSGDKWISKESVPYSGKL